MCSLVLSSGVRGEGLQSAWLRLTRPLPTHNRYRSLLIGACIHLNNFRTRVDDIGEIRTVYDREWTGNWRGAAYEDHLPSSRLRRAQRTGAVSGEAAVEDGGSSLSKEKAGILGRGIQFEREGDTTEAQLRRPVQWVCVLRSVRRFTTSSIGCISVW